MKPSILIASGLTLAFLTGAGGYFLGSQKAARASSSEPVLQGSKATPGSLADPRLPVTPAVDFKKLRATLDAEKNPLTRFKLATQNLEAWMGKNPEEALNWLASQSSSERRDEIMRLALGQYSETDPRGAAKWALANLNGTDLNNTIISIAESWARQNGAEAAAWFAEMPDTAERTAAMENGFFAWASNEPTAALEFIKSRQDLGGLSPILRRAALAGWAKTDPEGAVAASLTLSRTVKDTAQFANTLANWATMDLAASSSWLLTHLKPGAERTTATEELASIFASQAPTEGIAWLDKLEPGEERDRAANELVASWSRSSPAETATWAASQTASTLSEDAIISLSRNFLMKNSAAFETWRAGLPAGPLKKAAAQVGMKPEEE